MPEKALLWLPYPVGLRGKVNKLCLYSSESKSLEKGYPVINLNSIILLPMDHKHWRGHVFDKSRWIPFLIELLIVHLLIQEKSAQLSDWEEELICLQRIAHGVEDSIVSYITSDIVDVRIHVVHERGSKTCTHGTDLLSTKICLIRMRINVRPSVHYVLQWVAVPIPTDRLLKHLAKATGSVEVCC
eukprot:XP_001707930.1 Hypothetical protein GL50803_35157 [Giardia lamblia ATCC 50803]